MKKTISKCTRKGVVYQILNTKAELYFVINWVITQLIRKMHIRAHTPPPYLTPGLCGHVDLLGILFISLYIQLQLHTNYIKNTSQHEPPAASACEHTAPSPQAPISLSFPSSSSSLLWRFRRQMPDCYLSESNLLLVSTTILFDLSNRVETHKWRKQPKSSGLVSLNTHCWHVLINSVLFFPAPCKNTHT